MTLRPTWDGPAADARTAGAAAAPNIACRFRHPECGEAPGPTLVVRLSQLGQYEIAAWHSIQRKTEER